MERQARTGRGRRRESEWQRFRRLFGRYMKQRMKEHVMAMAVFGLAIGVIAGMAMGTRLSAFARQHAMNDYGREKTFVTYEVQYGDTLWSIAKDLSALNPEYNDIRQYVSELERVNAAYGGHIEAGDVILIPYFTSADGVETYESVYGRYGID